MYVGSFQSNKMQLNTSVFHGATAYLKFSTQLPGQPETQSEYLSGFRHKHINLKIRYDQDSNQYN